MYMYIKKQEKGKGKGTGKEQKDLITIVFYFFFIKPGDIRVTCSPEISLDHPTNTNLVFLRWF